MQSKTLKYLSYGSMAVLIAMMMAASVIEKLRGAETAQALIYHHPVFFVFWAVAAVSGLALLVRRIGWKRPATLAMHAAFVLILVGALVTHLTGQSGSMHLRAGEPSATVELEDGSSLELPFALELKEFRIEYDPGTRHVADYISELSDATISMNHILKRDGYRFYQADYDEDLQGSILAVSHDPWGVGITYAGYLLLALSMLGFFFERDSAYRQTLHALRPSRERGRSRKGWTVVLCAVGAGFLVAWLLGAFPKGHLMPVLRSPMLYIHVIPMMVCYSIFSLLALTGIVGLFLPEKAAGRLALIARSVLLPAVFLLALGTFLGAVWANISWGNYWAWDPKETWALVTLLIYSFALQSDSLPVMRKSRFFHLYCILAFVAVLITYFGVNLFLGGVHSYA